MATWPATAGSQPPSRLAPATLGVGRDVSGRARAEAGHEGSAARGHHAAGAVHGLAVPWNPWGSSSGLVNPWDLWRFMAIYGGYKQ